MDTRKSAGILTPSRGCGCALQTSLDEILRRVLHAAKWDLVLQSVDQLDVADRTGQLPHVTGNAFISFSAQAYRPFHRIPSPTEPADSELTFDR